MPDETPPEESHDFSRAEDVNERAQYIEYCPDECFSLAGSTVVGELLDAHEHLEKHLNKIGECPVCGLETVVEWT